MGMGRVGQSVVCICVPPFLHTPFNQPTNTCPSPHQKSPPSFSKPTQAKPSQAKPSQPRNVLVRVPLVRHQEGRADEEIADVLDEPVAGFGGLEDLRLGFERGKTLGPQPPDLLVAVAAYLK